MNNRRSFFRKSTAVLAGFGILPRVLAHAKARPVKGRFIHMVFFWLKEEVDPDQFRKDTEAFLKQVPEIIGYHLGSPAGTPRPVVDNSYNVSLVVTFDSKEDQDAYQVNPIHKAYVEANKDKWTSVKIYDSWGML